jgi:hypothetical protein
MVPEFDEAGVLPAGIHDATWDELTTRFGTSPHRRQLLVGLKRALDSLRSAGCRRAYVNGSFVTAKDEPGDFDGYWDASGVDPDRLDPMLLDFSNARRAQKAKFGGELFPGEAVADPAGTRFLDYLQQDKNTGTPKGIVALDLKDLP